VDREARARLTDSRIMAIADMIEAAVIEAVAAERERCAKIIEATTYPCSLTTMAAAIRNRKE
jgi:hypothetical protein